MKTKVLKIVFDRDIQLNELNSLFNSYNKSRFGNQKISFKRNKGYKRSFIATCMNTSIFGESARNLNSVQVDFLFSDEMTHQAHQEYDCMMLSSEHNCSDATIQSKIIQMFFDYNIIVGVLTKDFKIIVYTDSKKVSDILPNVIFGYGHYKSSRIGFAKDVVKDKLLDVVEASILRAEKEISEKNKQIASLNNAIEKYKELL